MTAQQKHTPMRIDVDDLGELWIINDSGTICRFGTPEPIDTERARFIVNACNLHEELVKALQGMLEAFCGSATATKPPYDVKKNTDAYAAARAVLAKAKGE